MRYSRRRAQQEASQNCCGEFFDERFITGRGILNTVPIWNSDAR